MNLQKYFETDSADNGAGGAQPEEEAGFDLSDFLRIVRVRRKVIVGTTAVVFALAALFLFHATPMYNASSEVMLDSRQNRVEQENDALTGYYYIDPMTVQNQLMILKSRGLMSRVIDKLHLLDDGNARLAKPSLLGAALHYANPLHWIPSRVSTETAAEKEQHRRDGMINYLLAGETVKPEGLSSALSITFTSPDPNKAASVCNAIADAYVEDQLAAKFEATQKATQWLADRIKELAAQVQAAEAAVQEYKAENGLTDTTEGGSLVDQQMANLNNQLVLARSDLAEKEARYERVLHLQKSGHPEDISQVVESPMILQLREQETDLLRQEADLRSKYGPRHPKMLDLESQKRNLEAKIAEEVQRVAQTVGNDVAVARSRIGSLEGSMSQLTGRSTVDNKARVQLTALEAKANSSRQLYEAFLERFKQTQGQEGIQTPDARIISRAVVPASPSSPRIVFTLAMALPGGLILGLILAFLIERFDNGFRTTSQVERQLGLPVLSVIPELNDPDHPDAKAIDRIVDKPTSAFSEAVRGLQMGLFLSNVDKKPKVVLITSSVPDEGKTTLAISLARLAALGQKKTLLVDADLRHCSVARALGISGKGPKDLAHLLAGEAALDQCLQRDPSSPVTVLAASAVKGSPVDILGSDTMKRFVEELRNRFDFIVIDSSPLLPVNDTKAIAALADAVLLAIRWEKTPRDAVSQSVRMLADVGAPVAGVAFTRANAERYRYYSYGYQDYHSYNKYYGD